MIIHVEKFLILPCTNAQKILEQNESSLFEKVALKNVRTAIITSISKNFAHEIIYHQISEIDRRLKNYQILDC